MFRVISANVNGIRSAVKKGFLDYINKTLPDVVCIQETKANPIDLDEKIKNLDGYTSFWSSAEKKGYSGVAMFAKKQPLKVISSTGNNFFDKEGRYLRIDYNQLSIISVYFPSGTSSYDRQLVKYQFLDLFYEVLNSFKSEKRDFIICGDWNIAHQNIDLKNWKGNQKNSGFLPQERDWLSKVLNSGWVDIFRTINPSIPGYTWWSNRRQAYAKDVGWRIDYQVTNKGFENKVLNTLVYKEIKFSDHAPLMIDYDFNI